VDWLHDLNLAPIDFELNSKIVTNSFLLYRSDATKFEDIIKNCRLMIAKFYINSNFVFIKKQINDVIRSLTKRATSSTSFQILIDIPRYIKFILINEVI
jgi:hypothetical protein